MISHCSVQRSARRCRKVVVVSVKRKTRGAARELTFSKWPSTSKKHARSNTHNDSWMKQPFRFEFQRWSTANNQPPRLVYGNASYGVPACVNCEFYGRAKSTQSERGSNRVSTFCLHFLSRSSLIACKAAVRRQHERAAQKATNNAHSVQLSYSEDDRECSASAARESLAFADEKSRSNLLRAGRPACVWQVEMKS